MFFSASTLAATAALLSAASAVSAQSVPNAASPLQLAEVSAEYANSGLNDTGCVSRSLLRSGALFAWLRLGGACAAAIQRRANPTRRRTRRSTNFKTSDCCADLKITLCADRNAGFGISLDAKALLNVFLANGEEIQSVRSSRDPVRKSLGISD